MSEDGFTFGRQHGFVVGKSYLMGSKIIFIRKHPTKLTFAGCFLIKPNYNYENLAQKRRGFEKTNPKNHNRAHSTTEHKTMRTTENVDNYTKRNRVSFTPLFTEIKFSTNNGVSRIVLYVYSC